MTAVARNAKGQGGFTLLELLVAITLLGLIATMAFSGFRLGTRAWEVADEYGHEVYLVQEMLRERIGAAHVPAELGAGTAFDEDELPFEGGPDHVRFIASLPDLFGVAGLYRVSIEVANGEALVMSWRLWRPQAGEATEADEGVRRVLLDGIENATFAFFGPREEFGAGSAWQDAWQGRTDLPTLVRIELEHPEEAWPALVIAPRAAGVI